MSKSPQEYQPANKDETTLKREWGEVFSVSGGVSMSDNKFVVSLRQEGSFCGVVGAEVIWRVNRR